MFLSTMRCHVPLSWRERTVRSACGPCRQYRRRRSRASRRRRSRQLDESTTCSDWTRRRCSESHRPRRSNHTTCTHSPVCITRGVYPLNANDANFPPPPKYVCLSVCLSVCMSTRTQTHVSDVIPPPLRVEMFPSQIGRKLRPFPL